MCMQIDDEHYVLCLYRLRQTKRKRRKMCTKQYQNGIDIISSNLHEYLTSILHNLIQQLLWNTWILFLRFQSIYRILCFTMHAQKTMRTICQMSNYWNWSILSHWSEYQIMIPMQLYSSFSFTIQQVDQHFKWNILIMCW